MANPQPENIIDGGYVKLYRKIFDSRVWANEGLLKVWLWCLLRANHKDTWVTVKTGRSETEVMVKPGQFIFGRKTAGKSLKMPPSTVWKRILKLEDMQNLNTERNTHYTIVSIVNWDSYQGVETKGNTKGDRQVTGKEQASDTDKNEKNDKNSNIPDSFESGTPHPEGPEEDFKGQILELKKKYTDPDLIDEIIKAFASTRKTFKISDSIVLAQLQRWEKYSIATVQGAGVKYLEAGYADQGKNEHYFWAMVRNFDQDKKPAQQRIVNTQGGNPAFPKTGSLPRKETCRICHKLITGAAIDGAHSDCYYDNL